MRLPITFEAITPARKTITMVVSRPRPGTSRLSRRSKSGAIEPSTTRKTHTSAATLMTSGTVTKKPAISFRRSHCISDSGYVNRTVGLPEGEPDGRRQRKPVVGEHIEAMRRQVLQQEPDRQIPDDRRGHDADDEQQRHVGGQ